MTKLRQADLKYRESLGLRPHLTPGSADGDGVAKQEKPTHIAFGSKVVIPPHARKSSSREGSTSAGGRHSQYSICHSSFNRSGSVPTLRSASPSVDGETSRETAKKGGWISQMRTSSDLSDSSKPQLGVEAVQTTIQPRPPRTGSGSKTRRRPVRVKGNNGTRSRNDNSTESCQKDSSMHNDGNNNLHRDRRTASESETDVSLSETISRSASESSLKCSENESSLSESFNKLSMNSNKNNANEERDKQLNEKDKLSVKSNELQANSTMFTFSSRPRSAPRSPRQRHKKAQENLSSSSIEEKPEIRITGTETNGHIKGRNKRYQKSNNKEHYEGDFCRLSGESSEEDNDVERRLRSSVSSTRSGSKSPKLSPLQSSEDFSPPVTPQCLRASIKSSLLKEVSILC